MDASDIVAIIRGLMLAFSIIILLNMYRKVPFKGFLIMLAAQCTWIIAWLLAEAGLVIPLEILHEILLTIVVLFWTIGIYLIYRELEKIQQPKF